MLLVSHALCIYVINSFQIDRRHHLEEFIKKEPLYLCLCSKLCAGRKADIIWSLDLGFFLLF